MSLAIPFFKFPPKMKKRDMCMHVFGIMDFFRDGGIVPYKHVEYTKLCIVFWCIQMNHMT